MEFDKSTQHKYWMFDEASLRECKENACRIVGDGSSKPWVRKCASGYHNGKRDIEGSAAYSKTTSAVAEGLSREEQEIIVNFHAQQLQQLIGPNAILPDLRRGSSVLSTAISLFRRFYLSNAVLDIPPRPIAVAAALLACKADCEQRLPIDVLSQATWEVELKTQHAPLYREQLQAVSIPEIESAERALLKGCDYRLRCHHPYGAIKLLASDVSAYIGTTIFQQHLQGEGALNGSPRSVVYGYPGTDHHLSTLRDRALSVAQTALVYSDVNFLFPPGQIAFAAVSVALDGHGFDGKLGQGMQDYLAMRFRKKTMEERADFELQVGKIVCLLESCPSIDLKRFSPRWQYCQDFAVAEQQADTLRRVLQKVSQLQKQTTPEIEYSFSAPVSPIHHPQPTFGQYYSLDPYAHRLYNQHHYIPYLHHPQLSNYFLPIDEGNKRKRSREDNHNCSHRRSTSAAFHHPLYPTSSYPHCYGNSNSNKVARVTPVMMEHQQLFS